MPGVIDANARKRRMLILALVFLPLFVVGWWFRFHIMARFQGSAYLTVIRGQNHVDGTVLGYLHCRETLVAPWYLLDAPGRFAQIHAEKPAGTPREWCGSIAEINRSVSMYPGRCLRDLDVRFVLAGGMVNLENGAKLLGYSTSKGFVFVDPADSIFLHVSAHEVMHLVERKYGTGAQRRALKSLWEKSGERKESPDCHGKQGYLSKASERDATEDVVEIMVSATHTPSALRRCSDKDWLLGEKGRLARQMLQDWCPELGNFKDEN